jgi:hypothetical protein
LAAVFSAPRALGVGGKLVAPLRVSLIFTASSSSGWSVALLVSMGMSNYRQRFGKL